MGADATINYRDVPEWYKATRDITGGRGYDHIDFAALLLETARDAGLDLVPDGVAMDDGLSAEEPARG